MLDVDGFQTCFGSAASAFEIIELANIHCALKENFSVALTEKYGSREGTIQKYFANPKKYFKSQYFSQMAVEKFDKSKKEISWP